MKIRKINRPEYVYLQAENGEEFRVKKGDFLNLTSQDGVTLNGRVQGIECSTLELSSARGNWFGSVPYHAISRIWNVH